MQLFDEGESKSMLYPENNPEVKNYYLKKKSRQEEQIEKKQPKVHLPK